MYDGVTLYIERDKAIQEGKFLIETLKEYELYTTYFKALGNDILDRPGYYIGSLGTSGAIGAILASRIGTITLTNMKLHGLSLDAMHDVMEELRKQLGASEEEFFKMLEDDTLQDKIAENIKMCLDQVHCKDGVAYVMNQDGSKGYRLENNEWKWFEVQKDKLLNQNVTEKINDSVKVRDINDIKSLEELVREFAKYKEENQQTKKDMDIDFER
jgi:hypothetical protein